jgi:hypothetical protein
MKNDEQTNLMIQQKCSPCFREEECLLLPSQRGECLGPFIDVQDQLNKFQTYHKENIAKPDADLDRAIREVLIKDYLRKKKLFDDSEDQ